MLFTPSHFAVLDYGCTVPYPGTWRTCCRVFQFSDHGIKADGQPSVLSALYDDLAVTAHAVIGGNRTVGVYDTTEVAYWEKAGSPYLARVITTPGLAARVANGEYIPRDDLLYAGLIVSLTNKPVNLHYMSLNGYAEVKLPFYKTFAITLDRYGEIEKNFKPTSEKVTPILTAIDYLHFIKDEIPNLPRNASQICPSCPYFSKCTAIYKQHIETLKVLKSMGDKA